MKGLRPRLTRWIAVAIFAAATAACGQHPATMAAGLHAGSLDEGRRAADSWVTEATRGRTVHSEDVLAIGYLERERLGLGSPFRLADYALADPRLTHEERRTVAWALLARAESRGDYSVDPVALDAVSNRFPLDHAGEAHLDLIESAIREARNPRAGELAVRLAYALAAAEGSVSRAAPSLAAQAAALIRDRELARRDVRRLLSAAQRASADPLTLIPRWRSERYFLVEQPVSESLPTDAEEEAVELAPRLASAIRDLAAGSHRIATSPRPLLTPSLAYRLAALTDSLNPPPETPIVMAVRMHGSELRSGGGLVGPDSAEIDRFEERARDEERFAAEHALLWQETTDRHDIPARIAMAAAVSMRPYAQESPWFPGMAAPSESDLETRFGLAGVVFDDSVPDGWRPYYRRMLATSLTDLERVLPSLTVRGLRVRVGALRGNDRTLALHNPRTRTVFLPPRTGAGTIAHELAHDLDWQVALRRYRVRGDYATDRATLRGAGSIASRMQQLADGALEPPPATGTRPDHERRPAEVFARSMDWLVTQALAREGRSDGYLSSVQDAVLTGYGSVTPPDYTGRAGDALVAILDEVAPLPADLRRWYLERQGVGRPLTAYDLVRTVLEAPVPVESDMVLVAAAPVAAEDSALVSSPSPQRADARFAAIAAARDAAMGSIDAWICGTPGAAYDRELQDARRRLVARTALARARGIAMHRAGELAGRAGREWMARELFGEPRPTEPLDSATAAILSALATRAREAGEIGPAVPDDPFRLTSPPPPCYFTARQD